VERERERVTHLSNRRFEIDFISSMPRLWRLITALIKMRLDASKDSLPSNSLSISSSVTGEAQVKKRALTNSGTAFVSTSKKCSAMGDLPGTLQCLQLQVFEEICGICPKRVVKLWQDNEQNSAGVGGTVKTLEEGVLLKLDVGGGGGREGRLVERQRFQFHSSVKLQRNFEQRKVVHLHALTSTPYSRLLSGYWRLSIHA